MLKLCTYVHIYICMYICMHLYDDGYFKQQDFRGIAMLQERGEQKIYQNRIFI